MLHPDDIQRLCQRKYPAFLKSVVTGAPFFPLEIRFGRPSTSDEWEKLRQETAALAGGRLGYRIEWIETNTRRWGRQKFPERVWFETEAEFLRALGKAVEVQRLRSQLALAREQCPELEPWLAANPARVVEFSPVWPDLLKVCRYFIEHPRPGLYARELPVAVDTKFIERHAGILRSLLDFLLPTAAKGKEERFEERFGLRHDEPQIRFRLLDESLREALGVPFPDVALPVSRFRELGWRGLRVIVSENKMTFLTLPPVTNGVGIWGAGNAAALLHEASWLRDCDLFYWGDVDGAGFEILGRLRQRFPRVRSLLMDLATIECRSVSCVVVPRCPQPPALDSLTAEEAAAYAHVTQHGLRLEQERIPQSAVRAALLTVRPDSCIP